MRRLLFVVNVDWFFLSHRLPLALAAQKAGFEVHVATTLTDRAPELAAQGIIVHPLGMDRRSASPLEAAKLLWALLRLMRSLRPAVVHLVTVKPVLLGGIAARMAGVPRVIAAISGLGFIFTAQGKWAALRRAIVSALYRVAVAHKKVTVIFQNEDDRTVLQQFTGIASAQCFYIRGSGVDLSTWQATPLPPYPPVVLMASRLLRDKGVVEFVEAARLLKGYKSARFVLVGGPDEGNPTSLRVEDLKAWVDEGVVEWWGLRDSMPTVLSSAHIVALPSYREGLPKGLIEAAAAGRAVITTDVPGCRDAIEPGVSGLLVAVRDARSLANGIKDLLDDQKRIEAMGLEGRRLAERVFDIDEVVAKHLLLYKGG